MIIVMKLSTFPVLETERLILRQVNPDDAESQFFKSGGSQLESLARCYCLVKKVKIVFS